MNGLQQTMVFPSIRHFLGIFFKHNFQFYLLIKGYNLKNIRKAYEQLSDLLFGLKSILVITLFKTNSYNNLYMPICHS